MVSCSVSLRSAGFFFILTQAHWANGISGQAHRNLQRLQPLLDFRHNDRPIDDPSRLGGQKEPVYPVILLATHTGTLIFSGCFWARIGSEEQTAITEVLRTSSVSSSPECYQEAVAAIQLDAGGCLRESIPVALQSRFSALRISST
jgi:hypothetical protein